MYIELLQRIGRRVAIVWVHTTLVDIILIVALLIWVRVRVRVRIRVAVVLRRRGSRGLRQSRIAAVVVVRRLRYGVAVGRLLRRSPVGVRRTLRALIVVRTVVIVVALVVILLLLLLLLLVHLLLLLLLRCRGGL